MNFLKSRVGVGRRGTLWPTVGRKVPLRPTGGRKVPFRPTRGRRGDTFDFSPLGCIVSEFAIKIIIVSKKILNAYVNHAL